jgi:hypothetical protein
VTPVGKGLGAPLLAGEPPGTWQALLFGHVHLQKGFRQNFYETKTDVVPTSQSDEIAKSSYVFLASSKPSFFSQVQEN